MKNPTLQDIIDDAKRKAKTTCRCEAYPFPHRPGGGDCDTKVIVHRFDSWLDYSDVIYGARS